MGSVAGDVQDRLATIARPIGYDLIVAGNYEEQQKSFDELVVSLALALVLVYMVLACQYESLRDPLVVMLSVPLAIVGVLITLFLTGTTFNVQSYIGCIMLGGIVVNNAILLVDQAGQLNRGGMHVREAAIEAGRRRLRPILMTTLTTILGLIPLALGIGEGADAQAPLARAVIGGLAGSTMITLVLIPTVYTLFHPDPEGIR
jgi:HAE1 family hydrophobic/amphiphilic exporter-1